MVLLLLLMVLCAYLKTPSMHIITARLSLSMDPLISA